MYVSSRQSECLIGGIDEDIKFVSSISNLVDILAMAEFAIMQVFAHLKKCLFSLVSQNFVEVVVGSAALRQNVVVYACSLAHVFGSDDHPDNLSFFFLRKDVGQSVDKMLLHALRATVFVNFLDEEVESVELHRNKPDNNKWINR